MFKQNLTQKPQFILCPSFVKECLENKFIEPKDLTDFKKLSSILSVEQVKKFLYLNLRSFSPKYNAYTYANSYIVELCRLLLADAYWTEQQIPNMDKWRAELLTVSCTEEALFDGLDFTSQMKLLEALPQNYHQCFDVVQIDAYTYGIIFTDMKLIEGDAGVVISEEHQRYFIDDMKKVFNLIGFTYPDTFLVDSPIYRLYVKALK